MPKKPISIRLETDLIDWFKSQAPHGYQGLIQQVLDNYRRENELRIQKILGRAQQIYLQYHGKCFWHLKADLIITKENLEIVKNGLRKYGGLKGLRLAEDLEL